MASDASGPRAAIVVPCHNEERRLSVETFAAFIRARPELRFVFVNDGSTDGTAAVLTELQRRAGAPIVVCDLPRNVGKAEAIRAGLQRAFALDAPYCGFWDADLATPLEAILDFCALLDAQPGVDLVLGARVRLLGRRIERRATRHYVGRVAATIISLTLGLPVYDTQCGAKMFRATPAMRALFAAPFISSWIFDVEILARLIEARRDGASVPAQDVIVEYPLAQWRDVEGSNLGPRDYLQAAVDLARIYRRHLRA